jgi:hypothetical protein
MLLINWRPMLFISRDAQFGRLYQNQIINKKSNGSNV